MWLRTASSVVRFRGLPDPAGHPARPRETSFRRSRNRPRVPIFAFTPNPATYQALAVYWGVVPVLFSVSSPHGNSIFVDIDKVILNSGMLARGDRIVITLGYPVKDHKSVNLLKLHVVGESLPAPPTS